MKVLVPVNTTIKELMQNLGANNPEAKKNRLFEVAEAGNGRWLKGMEIGVSEISSNLFSFLLVTIF